MSQILITGGSGFLGSHAIIRALAAKHGVRTTLRNLHRKDEVLAMLRAAEAANLDRLQFFVADLEKDDGWRAAVEGCEYVLHIASPFPGVAPKDENELIRPARDGALRVLRAAKDAGVKRVVMTSSFAAIGYGHEARSTPFDENDWSNLESGNVPAYHKSKTLAERAAWDFAAKEADAMQLTVINPVGIFGPIMGPDYSTSINLIKRMLEGAMPGVPKIYFGVVDVRDLADLHLLAMVHPEANGQRFLASAGDCVSMYQIAVALRKGFGEKAKKVPRIQLPNWFVRLAAKRKPEMRGILPELGKIKHLNNQKARQLLGWNPRSSADAVVATAESLLSFNLLTNTKK